VVRQIPVFPKEKTQTAVSGVDRYRNQAKHRGSLKIIFLRLFGFAASSTAYPKRNFSSMLFLGAGFSSSFGVSGSGGWISVTSSCSSSSASAARAAVS
jgi:hypothetical protein